MKQALKAIFPESFFNKARKIKDELHFITLLPEKSYIENLRAGYSVCLPDIYTDTQIKAAWDEDHKVITALYGNDDSAGGVNPGDRRALYYLIMAFKPLNILEVGTHIGASTLHIARALKQLGQGGCVTSADIVDVNNPETGAWKSAELKYSPKGFAEALECADHVEFYCGPCLKLMNTTQQSYDFIFLDGDHSAKSVYQEVNAALPLLTKGGMILLHDYYPDSKALYPDGNIINGPYRAMKRIMQENPEIQVLPLGELPWPTKQGTNYTSLALVLKL